MATFEYDAYDPAGRVTRGTVDAASALEASRRIGELGLIPFATRPVEAGTKISARSLPPQGRRRLSEADLAGLVRELAALLRAEIPVDAALSLMNEQARSRRLGLLLGQLHDAVRSGARLSEAIVQIEPRGTALTASFVRAGEARGDLAETLTDLSTYLDRKLQVQAQVRAALKQGTAASTMPPANQVTAYLGPGAATWRWATSVLVGHRARGGVAANGGITGCRARHWFSISTVRWSTPRQT